jgi:hypothetical protein
MVQVRVQKRQVGVVVQASRPQSIEQLVVLAAPALEPLVVPVDVDAAHDHLVSLAILDHQLRLRLAAHTALT